MPDPPSEFAIQLEAMQTALLSKMEIMINTKLETVHESLTDQQRQLAAVQIDKINDIKYGSGHKFKKPGNEEQFKFNAEVQEKITTAKRAIEREDKNEALAAAEEGSVLIKDRQKLILMADSSDVGWAVVKEYAKNDLADDSEDEKRILRATARAERKVKQQRAKRQLRFSPYQPRPTPGNPPTSTSSTRPKPGACFSCSAPGHWSRECPKRGGATSSKISIGGGGEAVSPVGRLRECKEFWEELTDNQYVLGIIQNGYTIPFTTIPENCFLKNNKSALDNCSFVSDEIGHLLEKRCIEKVDHAPRVVNPLTVAGSASSKKRLVLDCRHINSSIAKFGFRYEEVSTAHKLMKGNDFYITFDLKSAYHHIQIREDQTEFLGFEWKGSYYVFKVLPFGICCASHIFTKVCRVLVNHWRSMGIKIVLFIDDGIGIADSYEAALQMASYLKLVLSKSGFLIAEEKCTWVPCTRVKWLGVVWDSSMNHMTIAEARIISAIASLKRIYLNAAKENVFILSRELASTIGKIISMSYVLGAITFIKTKCLYEVLNTRASWQAKIKMNISAFDEINFWLTNIKKLNGKVINDSRQALRIFSDASSTGYGGIIEADLEHNHCMNVDDNLVFNMNEHLLELDHLDETPSWRALNAGWSPVGAQIVGSSPTIAKVTVSSSANEKNAGSSPADSKVGGSSPDGAQVGGSSPDGAQVAGSSPAGAQVAGSSPVGGMLSQFECDSRIIQFGNWNEAECKKSSSWRELEAILRIFKTRVEELRNKIVYWQTDCKNLIYILEKGSKIKELNETAECICNLSRMYNCKIIANWIPRNLNVEADKLSRCFDADDWSIRTFIFKYLNEDYGPFTIDRFATDYNAKCLRFNSRWWVPGCESVDALKQNWDLENNWIVPPPRLILDCLKKIDSEKVKGVLIIPNWTSAEFWPIVLELIEHKKLNGISLLPRDCVQTGKGENGIFNGNLGFDMISFFISS